MKQSILGYIAIGIIAIIISLISTSSLVDEERKRARRKMLSIQMKQQTPQKEDTDSNRFRLSSQASGLRTGVLE